LLLNLLEDAHDPEGLPGQSLKDHEVDGDAKGPHIGLVGVFLLFENLWTHVLECSRKSSSFLVGIVFVYDLGYSEV